MAVHQPGQDVGQVGGRIDVVEFAVLHEGGQNWPDPRTLPLDSHMLLALVAPRPLLLINGSTDTWSDPTGEWQAAQAATAVYRLLGREGVPAKRPPLGQIAGRGLAVITHEGPHGLLPQDIERIADFLDAELSAQQRPQPG